MPNAPLTSPRRFTDKARARALEIRRLLAAMPKPPDEGVYVTRSRVDERLFVWEIRRFGGVVLERGATPFADPDHARSAGDEALAALLRRTGKPDMQA